MGHQRGHGLGEEPRRGPDPLGQHRGLGALTVLGQGQQGPGRQVGPARDLESHSDCTIRLVGPVGVPGPRSRSRPRPTLRPWPTLPPVTPHCSSGPWPSPARRATSTLPVLPLGRAGGRAQARRHPGDRGRPGRRAPRAGTVARGLPRRRRHRRGGGPEGGHLGSDLDRRPHRRDQGLHPRRPPLQHPAGRGRRARTPARRHLPARPTRDHLGRSRPRLLPRGRALPRERPRHGRRAPTSPPRRSGTGRPVPWTPPTAPAPSSGPGATPTATRWWPPAGSRPWSTTKPRSGTWPPCR